MILKWRKKVFKKQHWKLSFECILDIFRAWIKTFFHIISLHPVFQTSICHKRNVITNLKMFWGLNCRHRDLFLKYLFGIICYYIYHIDIWKRLIIFVSTLLLKIGNKCNKTILTVSNYTLLHLLLKVEN